MLMNLFVPWFITANRAVKLKIIKFHAKSGVHCWKIGSVIGLKCNRHVLKKKQQEFQEFISITPHPAQMNDDVFY